LACRQIDKVPYEHLAIDQLNEHFKKFGLIVNIQLFPHEKRALIEFSSNAEAQAAVKSPDPIFGNRYGVLLTLPHCIEVVMILCFLCRFIKVFFYNAEENGAEKPGFHQNRAEELAEAQKERAEAQKEKAAAAAASAALLEQKRLEILDKKKELQKQKDLVLDKLIEEQKSVQRTFLEVHYFNHHTNLLPQIC